MPRVTCAGVLQRTAWCLGTALLLALPACVTTYEEMSLSEQEGTLPANAVMQTIPFGEPATTAEQRVLHELYAGVFLRLQEAAKEGDPAQIEALLAAYERGALPTWAVARLAGYRALALGLRFTRHARESGSLSLLASGAGETASESRPPALGETLNFQYSLPAPNEPVDLGGRMDDDPCGFAVSLTIEDTFVDGSSRRDSQSGLVWVPQRLRLAGDVTLTLPVTVDLPSMGAVRRNVNVRLDILPGYVGIGDVRAAISRTTVAATSITQWPPERAEVLADPLDSLRKGLRLGGIAGGRRAYLAALAATGADRQTAMELLIEQVRVGRGDQELVAMSALRSMTSLEILVGDRDGWLAWWQARQ